MSTVRRASSGVVSQGDDVAGLLVRSLAEGIDQNRAIEAQAQREFEVQRQAGDPSQFDAIHQAIQELARTANEIRAQTEREELAEQTEISALRGRVVALRVKLADLRASQQKHCHSFTLTSGQQVWVAAGGAPLTSAEGSPKMDTLLTSAPVDGALYQPAGP